MATIFSKIIKGEIPAYKIAENQDYFAFLDIRPMAPGHTLVIPKVEVDYLFDLSDDHLSGLMVFAKRVGKAIEREVDCERIGLAVIGLEVPHAHVHLVPINKVGDLSFSKAPVKLSDEEMAGLAQRIAARLESIT